MGNYYYLAASLPPLEFSRKNELSLVALQEALELNLSQSDMDKVRLLRLFTDLCNIKPLLQEEEIDPKGNLKEKELEDALLSETGLPEYVFEFLKDHESLEDKLRAFPALLSQFFQEETPSKEGFLKSYFEFERQWRIVVLAYRARRIGKDLLKELQFEDIHDPFVMQILAQKDADVFEPPLEYQEIRNLFQSCGQDPWQQSKSLCMYRFQRVQEMVSDQQFSMDWILGYLARMMIIEYWNELDPNKGQAILETFKKD